MNMTNNNNLLYITAKKVICDILKWKIKLTKKNNLFMQQTLMMLHIPGVPWISVEQNRLYNIHYLTYIAFVSVVYHNGVDIDCDHVNYGVVYAYVYEIDVIQLQFYKNIQGSNPYDNKKLQ